MEAMMRRVNGFLNERTEGEKYATVFYCTVDPSGTMHWTNAGHCPPILLRTNGEMEMLRATGTVGMLEEASFEVRQTELKPGDKVIAYTDGVAAAQNCEGAFFDVKRMKEVIRRHATSSCVILNGALMEAFTEGAIQSDDITTVVIEYQPG